jgi:hypothetical protein
LAGKYIVHHLERLMELVREMLRVLKQINQAIRNRLFGLFPDLEQIVVGIFDLSESP